MPKPALNNKSNIGFRLFFLIFLKMNKKPVSKTKSVTDTRLNVTV